MRAIPILSVIACLMLAPSARADFAVGVSLTVNAHADYVTSGGITAVSVDYTSSGFPQSYDLLSQAASDGVKAEVRGSATLTFAGPDSATVTESYAINRNGFSTQGLVGPFGGYTHSTLTFSFTPDVASTLLYGFDSEHNFDGFGAILLGGSGQILQAADAMGADGSAPLLAGQSYSIVIPLGAEGGLAAGGVPGGGETAEFGDYTVAVVPATPEPASALLLGVGGMLLAAWCWLRRGVAL
jgi:hypothetical protein